MIDNAPIIVETLRNRKLSIEKDSLDLLNDLPMDELAFTIQRIIDRMEASGLPYATVIVKPKTGAIQLYYQPKDGPGLIGQV